MSSLRLALRLSLQDESVSEKRGRPRDEERKEKKGKIKKKKRKIATSSKKKKSRNHSPMTLKLGSVKTKKRKSRDHPPMTPKLGSLHARRTFRDQQKKIEIVVIGGGIAGLAAAAEIAKRGKDAKYPLNITILEARDRLGGRVNTVELQDKTCVDLGAAFVHGTSFTFLSLQHTDTPSSSPT